ncbi:MAG: hypothetical protein N838_24970 [Thiohalocapsa sp. PB-PSB1]|nr:MAG: hypothetical protein N838_24970 [Thiohalocapsa sp. PB-PSB1]
MANKKQKKKTKKETKKDTHFTRKKKQKRTPTLLALYSMPLVPSSWAM